MNYHRDRLTIRTIPVKAELGTAEVSLCERDKGFKNDNSGNGRQVSQSTEMTQELQVHLILISCLVSTLLNSKNNNEYL